MGRVISQALPAFTRAATLSGAPTTTTTAPVVKATTYAPFATTVSSTDLADVVTSTDGLGRMVSMQRTVGVGVGGVVERSTAGWDAAGRMTSWVVDAAGSSGAPVVHSFVYDTLGRLVQAEDPDVGLRVHTWTDGGRLASSENAEGDEAFYAYDAVGRLVSRRGVSSDYDETALFRYDWNPFVDNTPSSVPSNWGHLMAVEGPGDDYGYMALDGLGRVASTFRLILSHGGDKARADLRTEFSWSGKPLVNWVFDGGGLERIRVEHDYDHAGRLRWMGYGVEGSNANLLWEAVDILPSGASEYEHLGNGIATRFERDVLDQVTGVRVADIDSGFEVWDRGAHAVISGRYGTYHSDYAGAASSAFRYDLPTIVRNAYGAIRGAFDSAVAPGSRNRDAHFSYDLGARLVDAVVADHAFAYSYDARQNLTSRTATLASGAPTPNIALGTYVHGGIGYGPRQLAAVGTTVFTYDAAGRTDTITGADYTRSWYDAFDRVRRVGVDFTDYTDYTDHRYDAGGARASTTWPDGSSEYYFGGGLTERDDRWELSVSLGGARQVARINVHKDAGSPLSGPEEVVYLHQGLGHGPSLLTDVKGRVLEERHFEPYGAPLWGDTDYDAERHGWNGKPVDPNNGWSDHGARWHATRYARWLSPDPPLKGPAGWPEQGFGATPYGYVAGNPVLLWDPDGKTPDSKNRGHEVWLMCGGGRLCSAEREAGFHQLIQEKRERDVEEFGPTLLLDIVLMPVGGPLLSRGIGLATRLATRGISKAVQNRALTISAQGAKAAAGYVSRSFAPGQLEAHFAKHMREWGVGNITQAGYVKRAQRLLGSDVGGDVLGAVRTNGDVLRYNVRTNEFAVGAADGTIRTLFRPKDGMAYWLKQVSP